MSDEADPIAPIEALIAESDAARLFVREHTAGGPDEAAHEVDRVRDEIVSELVALSQTAERAKALRSYAQMFGCTLSEAKKTLG